MVIVLWSGVPLHSQSLQFQAHCVGWRHASNTVSLLFREGSEPTAWDGDPEVQGHTEDLKSPVPSPLCGMATHHELLWCVQILYPSSKPTVWDGDSPFHSLLNPARFVLSPLCGMVTIPLLGTPLALEGSGVLSPLCGMMTASPD